MSAPATRTRTATAPGVAIEAYLAAERQEIDAALQQVAESLPSRTPEALRAPMLYALGTRGKRLRPILCCTAFRALGGTPRGGDIHRFACAVEIVHTYSLVHDDLPCMDDDDLRRGRPTTHRAFPLPLAVVAGAALLPLAIELLDSEGRALELSATERSRMLVALCRAAGVSGMVGGQLRDLEAEQQPVDVRALEAIHRAKTGALLAASLQLGALAARARRAEIAAVSEYGRALGLAFQITDDVLDVIGDAGALGKMAGRDDQLGKATYPALFGLEGARRLARERATEAVGALRRGAIESPELEALADYVVERGR